MFSINCRKNKQNPNQQNPYICRKYQCMIFQWKGIFPALTTKFTKDDHLDDDLFLKNLNEQQNAGVSGIILGGTLGEASVLTDVEKEHLVRLSVNHINGKIPVILNIAEGSTDMARLQVKKAEDWGANGLMVLPPMRYKADDRENVTYLAAIASATSLPIMIYNNPIDYKNEITIDMFATLLAKHKNIQAVKESTRDISNVTRLKSRFGHDLAILCGVDTLALEALMMGADGWIAGLVCAFPHETVTIFDLCSQHRFEEALTIYRWFLPLLELDLHPKLVQYIKLAEQFCNLGSEHVRAPRLPLIGEERTQIEKIIMDGIACRPDLSKFKL